MPDFSYEISIFNCNVCCKSWDDYECDRKLRLKKCSICHSEICKPCFYNPKNKQHCGLCTFDISYFGKVSKEKNKCIIGRLKCKKV